MKRRGRKNQDVRKPKNAKKLQKRRLKISKMATKKATKNDFKKQNRKTNKNEKRVKDL